MSEADNEIERLRRANLELRNSNAKLRKLLMINLGAFNAMAGAIDSVIETNQDLYKELSKEGASDGQ